LKKLLLYVLLIPLTLEYVKNLWSHFVCLLSLVVLDMSFSRFPESLTLSHCHLLPLLPSNWGGYGAWRKFEWAS